MHDAEFGIGMYRYYAGVAPAIFRFLRFLLLLPGGDRAGGLAQLERASQRGVLVRGEAQFQIHVLYLWYEHKSQEALAIIRGLQQRYPHNPLFHQIEAEILDVYFHDHAASLKASEQLLALAQSARCSAPTRRTSGAPQHRQAIDRALTQTESARTRLRGARFGEAGYRFVGAEPTRVDEGVVECDRSGRLSTTTNALCLTTDFSHP